MGTTPRPNAGTGLAEVKQRQRLAWESGDYARVGDYLEAVGTRR
ncbi:hypothetical protein ACI2LC_35195 [Nonomuraea wenchangensis]